MAAGVVMDRHYHFYRVGLCSLRTAAAYTLVSGLNTQAGEAAMSHVVKVNLAMSFPLAMRPNKKNHSKMMRQMPNRQHKR